MLRFTHVDNDSEIFCYHWHFVYLHGEAESVNMQAFDDGGSAPDICVANEHLVDHETLDANQPKVIACEVDEKPAIVVLANRYNHIAGRIALLSDIEAMKHVLNVDDWR